MPHICHILQKISVCNFARDDKFFNNEIFVDNGSARNYFTQSNVYGGLKIFILTLISYNIEITELDHELGIIKIIDLIINLFPYT